MRTYSLLRDRLNRALTLTLSADEPDAWFRLHREADPSGVSGTGIVAIGEVWNGLTLLRWASGTPSINAYNSVDDLQLIHGHGGATRLEWTDRLSLDGALLRR